MTAMALSLWALTGLMMVPGAVEYVDLETGWTQEARGDWRMRVDHRGLLAMHHPWAPSEEGNFAMVWKDVALPPDWRGPIELAFYQSDDYHTSPDDPATKELAADAFVGHRRKQILVNNQPVWSADVSDPVQPGASAIIRVPLPVEPGAKSVRIALVAFDTEASTTELRGDYYRAATGDLTRETDPNRARFRTTIYWGDLALVQGDTELAPRPRPSERAVAARHATGWPPAPPVAQWKGKNIPLTLSAPAPLPQGGFPLEMGIPLPQGAAEDEAGVRLRAGGKALFTQKSGDGLWPDGSVRWLDVYLPVKPGMADLSISFAEDGSKAPPPIAIRTEEDVSLRVSANPLSWTTAQGAPMIEIDHAKTRVVDAIRLSLDIGGETIPGTNERCEVLDRGPGRCRVALEGRFEGLNAPSGSYTLHVTTYRDLPYIKLWFRFFNDTDRNLDLAHLRLEFDLPAVPTGVKLPDGPIEGDFTVEYTEPGRPRGDGPVRALDGPFFVAWEGGAIAVKHFRERLPKAVSLQWNTLGLDLCAGGSRPVTITPGEALSHEIWLATGAVDGAAIARNVEQPPVLVNPAYWCGTGALGPAAPLNPEHPFAHHLKSAYDGKSWEDLGQSLGIRHFPDGPYLGRDGEWSNDYDGRTEGLWQLWAMTGDRAWYDRALAQSAHVMDVAIIHSPVPGRDWTGAMHGPGPNHVSGPWHPALQGGGLALFGHWTDNPEAGAAYLGLADYCLRTGAGLQGVTLRHFASPFSTIYTAYRETGEVPLLEAGTARIEAMMKRTDRRRGVWFDWHGSEVYPGTSPWMAAQLAQPLLGWYALTGDPEAAQLLVGLADAILCENVDWDSPGAMRTYSPNPRFPDTRIYDPVVVPLLLAAHELTDDPFFRDGAEALWRRWLEKPEFLPVFNLAGHWPWTSQLAVGE